MHMWVWGAVCCIKHDVTVASNMVSGVQPDLQEAQNEIAEVRVLVLQRKLQPGGVSRQM